MRWGTRGGPDRWCGCGLHARQGGRRPPPAPHPSRESGCMVEAKERAEKGPGTVLELEGAWHKWGHGQMRLCRKAGVALRG